MTIGVSGSRDSGSGVSMSYGRAAAVVATIAGIAAVHAFTPTPGPSDAPSRLERQVVSEDLSPRRMPASFDANRPPVPILHAHRPSNGRITDASSNGLSRDDGAGATSSVSGERSARAAVERDGYKGVSVLRQRSDGLWSGRALRGTVEIEVTVDSTGKVAAN